MRRRGRRRKRGRKAPAGQHARNDIRREEGGAFNHALRKDVRRGRMIDKALTYGYSNARINVLKSQLIDSERMEEMINADSIESVVNILSNTVYSQDLVDLSLQHKKAR